MHREGVVGCCVHSVSAHALRACPGTGGGGDSIALLTVGQWTKCGMTEKERGVGQWGEGGGADVHAKSGETGLCQYRRKQVLRVVP
jgi:hypothetical protein